MEHAAPVEKATRAVRRQCLNKTDGVIVAASDYLKVLPNAIDRWLSRPIVSLGTDGFGRSEGRKALREFFEVDARFIAVGALSALARESRSTPSWSRKPSRTSESIPRRKTPRYRD